MKRVLLCTLSIIFFMFQPGWVNTVHSSGNIKADLNHHIYHIYLMQWKVQTIRGYNAIAYVETLTPLCKSGEPGTFQANRKAANDAIHQYIEKEIHVPIADFAAVLDCSLMESCDYRHHPNSAGYELVANVWYATITTK